MADSKREAAPIELRWLYLGMVAGSYGLKDFTYEKKDDPHAWLATGFLVRWMEAHLRGDDVAMLQLNYEADEILIDRICPPAHGRNSVMRDIVDALLPPKEAN